MNDADGKPITLKPIRPNAGTRIAYQRRLEKLIGAMHADVDRRIKAQYAAKPPELAQDASPARELDALMNKLAREWQGRFDSAAPDLAEYFATEAAERTDVALRAALRKAGFAIPFKMTAAQNDVLQATIAENVGLIKSIAEKYLTDVQGLVMRSVTTGRDLGPLAQALRHRYGVTVRRAALISLDQSNKATATMLRARQLEMGVEWAIWVHSAGGNHPRPSHVKAGRDKVHYRVEDGWFDPDAGERILPGQLIRCRCVSRTVIGSFKAT